jgi:predicted dithiol-disulfide oxidoreductase (DUF899 family)
MYLMTNNERRTMTNHITGTHEEWLAARHKLLEAEKELTRRSDKLAQRRQELPWVRIDKEYRFETDEGSASLAELFRGRSQLLVYHFMFGPDYCRCEEAWHPHACGLATAYRWYDHWCVCCEGIRPDAGITAEAFMKRIGVFLDKVASAILTALDGCVPTEINAIAVTPAGIEPLI